VVRKTIAVIGALLATAATSVPAIAGVANQGVAGASATNPIAGLPWGNYTGQQDEVFPAYFAATGTDRQLLGLIALRPRVRWFGAWYDNSYVQQTITNYITTVTAGNPDVLSQVAVFRLKPWESAACHTLPTSADVASYKQWVDAFANGIGSARVAMILQPDLPFITCVPHHSQVPLQEVAYAARVFDALPHTTVYIDVGAADWPSLGQATRMLQQAGVQYARGFALNATHYDTTANEIRFGAKVVRALGADGIPGRHFVINTSDNGRGFTYQQYHRSDFNNAAVCRSRSQARCVTLGIPPTTDVASPAWHLGAGAGALASKLVDGYLWYGRPWLDNQSDPFDLQRSLAIAATTPF
jgi:endoglucanase